MENEKKKGGKLIDISKKTFISVLILLFALVAVAIVLTYVLPKGEFLKNADGTLDYASYSVLEGASGINIFKGIFDGNGFIAVGHVFLFYPPRRRRIIKRRRIKSVKKF